MHSSNNEVVTDDDEWFMPVVSEDEAPGVEGAPQGAPQGTAWEINSNIVEPVAQERVEPTGQPVALSESDKVINAFEKFMERSATMDERTRLLKTMADLGLRASDAYWLSTFQNESYNAMFNAVPEKISVVVKAVLRDCVETIQDATDKQIKRANIDIQRRERELEFDVDKAGYELSNKLNVLIDKIYVEQKITIEKEVIRKVNLTKWTLFSSFAFLQMLIIVSTNSVMYFLATGKTQLPWFESGQNSSVGSWVFEACWNMPSGYVMSFMLIFGGVFYIWYDNFKRL